MSYEEKEPEIEMVSYWCGKEVTSLNRTELVEAVIFLGRENEALKEECFNTNKTLLIGL